MAWPGLAGTMLDALTSRDVFLVAGCAGAGAIFLAFGTLCSDLALAAVDPRARSGIAEEISARRWLAFVDSAGSDRGTGPRADCRRRDALSGTEHAANVAAPAHRLWMDGAVHLPVAAASTGWSSATSSTRPRVSRCAWFQRGRLLTSSDESAAPLVLLGTDSLGHDVFSRLLFGARTVAWLSRFLPRSARCCSAAVVGGVAGYAGGVLDDLLMRSDRLRARPSGDLRCARDAFSAAAGAAAATVFALLVGIFAVVGAPFIARGVRAIVRTERALDYASPQPAPGASHARILARHLLPATRGFIAVADHAAGPAVHRRGGDAVVRRSRISDRLPAGERCCATRANVQRVCRFPVAAQSGGCDVRGGVRAEPGACRIDGPSTRRRLQ